MPLSYRIPRKYVGEIPKLPPSVVQAETAIPVFVGFTQRAEKKLASDLLQKPFRIGSFNEYQQYFGDPPPQPVQITVDAANEPVLATAVSPSKYTMYYAVRSFYENGGGACYIFSVGIYLTEEPNNVHLYDDSGADSALTQIRKVDEITLLVFPDLSVLGEDNFYAIYRKALLQCYELRDRFAIIDVYPKTVNNKFDLNTTIIDFRAKIGTTGLQFGAAYFPYLKTAFNYHCSNSNITFAQAKGILDAVNLGDVVGLIKSASLGKILAALIEGITSENKQDKVRLLDNTWLEMQQYAHNDSAKQFVANALELIKTDLGEDLVVKDTSKRRLNEAIAGFVNFFSDSIKASSTNIVISNNSTAENIAAFAAIVTEAFCAKVTNVISQLYLQLPPSAAVAGIYAYVDKTRGVWKSPGNVPLQSVIEPVFTVNDNNQMHFSVSDTGKSINLIRAFAGRGVLVWGGRTLDGNNSEWRYVSVRRFFNMVEKSVKKAMERLVFEPNEASTWAVVKAMIENFLMRQWRSGALVGAKPEQAFYVAVGLTQTMTAADVLEGRMIVEIGMAAVRPAEFIILRLTQKMQPR